MYFYKLINSKKVVGKVRLEGKKQLIKNGIINAIL
jgi:hypothetical protein